MICYRDKTFCDAYGRTCANADCHRAFTEGEQVSAALWWGGPDAPVALSDFSKACEQIIPTTQAAAE